ncbi:sugar lactone lactonase YvrE [Palleronia aestuarii]|uniref:Sugar lactone lactonase YvrE n=1 Tax=Palleronia aestuarii TaxID=568105 RepID=A0A2W7P0L8_9RHOB|nr:SMP-30/gluconolactonase/LRE family protein [Palleronia aestuarii]PZX16992.1 sugar lactone lactonase YvrE [Palleronia aestuarii]
MNATLAVDIRCQLGECPVWSVAEQALWFVDITGKRLHRHDPATGETRTYSVPEEIGCFALARGGGFVAGLRSGVWLLDEEARVDRMLAPNPERAETNRFNDGRTDPAGRFLLGTIDEPKAGGTAGLYRYDRRGLEALDGGLMTSNGLAFSPDGRILYHSDTPRFTIFAQDYDPATGRTENRRVFARLDENAPDRGRPDGGAVDVDGCYWTALFEGGRVQRYAPDGRLLSEYPVPARCPTMIAFGGEDFRTLYITSARAGRSDDELAAHPLAGAVFALRTDVPGLPEPLFDPEA